MNTIRIIDITAGDTHVVVDADDQDAVKDAVWQALTGGLGPDDAPNEGARLVGEAVAQVLSDPTVTLEATRDALSHLGLRIEPGGIPTRSALTVSYKHAISPAQEHEIARCRDQDAALTLSGSLDHPTAEVRLGFIQRTLGRAGLERALDKAEAVSNGLDSEPAAEQAARKAVATAFTEAWQTARDRWLKRHAELAAGTRMAGPVLAGLRQAMAMSQDDMASKLHTSRDVLRKWETSSAPVGVTTTVWEIWETRVNDLLDQLPAGQDPVLPHDTDPELVAALAPLAAATGRRLRLAPEPRDRIAYTIIDW